MNKEEKQSARKSAQRLISSLSEDRRHSAAIKICNKISAIQPWKEAEIVLAYLSFGAELDADPLIRTALEEGKSVFVPRVKGHLMSFHQLTSLDGPFNKGVFGIREPLESSEQWEIQQSGKSSMIIVPGLAFDKTGARLGRGGGYYDRFLSETRKACRTAGYPAPLCIGYAYHEQIVEYVPTEVFDEKIDGLITDSYYKRL